MPVVPADKASGTADKYVSGSCCQRKRCYKAHHVSNAYERHAGAVTPSAGTFGLPY